MKKIAALFLMTLTSLSARSQCAATDVSVSSSDTAYVQLYHPGFFILPSGFANVCQWEVTTSFGGVVFDTITSGAAFEQGLVLFDHTVPITDSMFVTVVISNPITMDTCTLMNTLVWEETEVLPGSFIGNWAVIGFNPGISTAVEDPGADNEGHIVLFPSPAVDQLRIDAPHSRYALAIVNMTGALVHSEANFMTNQPLDVSHLEPGIYFVGLQDDRGVTMGMQKFIKM
jgi:hypothetical protein